MERFSRLKDSVGQSQRVIGCSRTCCQSVLGCINILLIGVGALLIGIAAYGTQHIHFVTLPVLAGFLASGIILFLLSILGLVGVSRQNQSILFIYMVATIFLFVVLLSVSITALSMTSSHRHLLITTGWDALDEKQKNHVEMMLKCCGLEKGDSREEWCKNVHSLTYNATGPCYSKLKEPVAKAAQCSGGVGLFFSLSLLTAVYAAFRHRNQLKEAPIAEGEGDVFL